MADHAELLDAAARAFARHGYAGATLERIAEEAGVSRVTLHRRGITRDALLAQLAELAAAAYREALWPALTDRGTGAERLELALAAICEQAERHMALLVALRAQSDRVFHREDPQTETRAVYVEPLERLLRDGAADGSLRVDDPAETATALFNVVGLTYVHLRTDHGWAPERCQRVVLDLVLHGVVAAGERA
jgi:AcrR family transcriptional regulator